MKKFTASKVSLAETGMRQKKDTGNKVHFSQALKL